MICTSISGKTLEEILTALDDPFVEFAEIRLDLCNLSDQEVRDLFETCEKPLIATSRTSDQHQVELAVESGARYADLAVDAPAEQSRHFQKICKEAGADLIRSYHNFEKTPEPEYLLQIVSRCFRYGGNIVKIACKAENEQDFKTILSIYETVDDPSRLVAFGIGEDASETRIEALKLGAPFTYAALDEPTAPGQQPVDTVHDRIYGDFTGFWLDDISVPASKSFAQRAIIAAALADGISHLRGYTPCDDNEAAVRVARRLGAKVTRRDSVLTVTGAGLGLKCGTPLNLESLDTGESGLLTRLMIPLMAALNSGNIVIEGKGTLLNRPLGNASDIMAAFGVTLHNESKHTGHEIFAPVKVRGNLIPGIADIPGSAGSQLISGLMMSLPLCIKSSKVYVGEPKSIPYMFITADVLRKFGIRVETELEGNAEMLELQDWSYCTGINFTIKGGQQYKAADMDLEGDWSTAANFLVAGALFGHCAVTGLDTSSLQADISIMDVLAEAGAAVSYDEECVSVHKAPLSPFNFDLSHSPDIFPICSVLAAFCPGESTLAGVGRLRAKESDRAAAILEMLEGLGVDARINGDNLVINGMPLAQRCLTGRMLKGGEFATRGDHRMAMALRVAAIAAGGYKKGLTMSDPECVSKSFPDFFEQF